MNRSLFGIAAGIVVAASVIPYLIETARGRTRPARGTYIAKSGLGVAFAASYWAVGAGPAVWTATAFAVTPLVVLMFARSSGIGGWTRLDRFVFGGVGLGLLAWHWTGNAAATVGMSVVLKWICLVPTLSKLGDHPGTESHASWLMALSGDLINLLALPTFQLAVLIPAINEVLMSAVVVGHIRGRARPGPERLLTAGRGPVRRSTLRPRGGSGVNGRRS